MKDDRPVAYILVGVPGSGKSTWARSQRWFDSCAYVSTDEHVERYAKEQGRTYSEVFDEYMPYAVELMCRDVNDAEAVSQDIIWDQTSTTVASRARKFRMLPGYKMIAVVFTTPDEDELARRLASRTGKEIPLGVVRKMIENWEEPSEDEGFDEIWRAQ